MLVEILCQQDSLIFKGPRPCGGGIQGLMYITFCREKELAKVTIKKEDLELIVSSTSLWGGEVVPVNLDCLLT